MRRFTLLATLAILLSFSLAPAFAQFATPTPTSTPTPTPPGAVYSVEFLSSTGGWTFGSCCGVSYQFADWVGGQGWSSHDDGSNSLLTIQSEDSLHAAEMSSVEVAGYSDTDFSLVIEANGDSSCYTSTYFCSSAIWASQDVLAGPYDVTVTGSPLTPVNSLRITASVNLHRTTGNFISAIHVFGTTSDTPTPTATFPFITATPFPTSPPFSGGGLPTLDERPPCTSTPMSDPTSTATQRAMIPTMSLSTVVLPHATIPVATLTMGATVPNTPAPTATGDPTTTLEPTATPNGDCRILQPGGPGGTAPPVVDFSLSDPSGGTCGSVFPEINIVIAPITSVLGIDLPIHFNGLNIQAHRIDICVDFQDVLIRFGDVNLAPFINAIFIILFVGMILQFRREL